MNIVITGSSGYLGSQLKTELIGLGHNLIPLDSLEVKDPVDLTNNDSLVNIELPDKYALIHLAFPLPGTYSNQLFTRKIRQMNQNLVETFHPTHSLIMSSTAIYSLDGHREEPWEVYGKLKLETENFLFSKLQKVTIFRPGTLIQQSRKSSMMHFLKQLKNSSFPLFPGNGNVCHPFTYTPDLISAVKKWSLSPDNMGIFDMTALEPISLRNICYLDRSVRVIRELKIPLSVLKRIGSDSIPILGISSWHLKALTYNFESAERNQYSHDFVTYRDIFTKWLFPEENEILPY